MKKIILILAVAFCFLGCNDFKKVKHNAKLIDKTLMLGKTKVELYEFQNGFKVAISENRRAPVCSLKMIYKVGSRNEDKKKGQEGISHMLEHLVFNGTENFPKEKVNELVKMTGGKNFNAYTSRDITAYTISLPSEHIEAFIQVYADAMKNVVINNAVLENEKNVVLSELKTRTLDNPDAQMYNELHLTALTKHPYRKPIIGTESSIKKYTVDGVYEYYNTYYAPNNAILIITGDVDTDKTLNTIEKYFSTIPPSRLLKETFPSETNQHTEKVKKMWVDVQRISIKMAYNIPVCTDSDTAAIDIFASMLSYGRNSKLKNEIYDKGLATAGAGSYCMIDPYLFFIYMTVLQKGQWRNVMNIYDNIIKDISDNGMKDEDLDRVLNLYMAYFYSRLVSNEGVSNMIQNAIIYYDSLESVNDYLLALKSVSSVDIQRVVKKYFTTSSRSIVYGFPRS